MKCRRCGCTEKCACSVAGIGCYWVEPDLCSMCASVRQVVSTPFGTAWFLSVLAEMAAASLMQIEV